ncbi:MAG: dTDP-4-dehydrorhamnose 3,5-epimerase [Burkholderiaceae bacterium]|jgi:dTDP-4-dehydrorhamnose 3,5-epimerase|nr:dTDP-4-dehydrorhamnose 3,5-epimerase [Burkholderiaceae bacterium]
MKLRTAAPSGWALFDSEAHHDERGWLAETMRIEALRAQAGEVRVVQQNLSASRRGVLRGLHYQVEAPQGKLVQVVQGRIFDAIVDLRRGSPSFGKSFVFEMRAESLQSLWVPPGFAHGFLALDDAVVLYAMTEPRVAQAERVLRWDSPELAIAWPLEGREPLLSARDRSAPGWREAQVFDSADFGHVRR